jgi:hypothetical protein
MLLSAPDLSRSTGVLGLPLALALLNWSVRDGGRSYLPIIGFAGDWVLFMVGMDRFILSS